MGITGKCQVISAQRAGKLFKIFPLKILTKPPLQGKILTLSVQTDKIAQIAQLVEQRTENPRVTGSIPVLGIFLCTTIINPTTTGKRKHVLPFFPIYEKKK